MRLSKAAAAAATAVCIIDMHVCTRVVYLRDSKFHAWWCDVVLAYLRRFPGDVVDNDDDDVFGETRRSTTAGCHPPRQRFVCVLTTAICSGGDWSVCGVYVVSATIRWCLYVSQSYWYEHIINIQFNHFPNGNSVLNGTR